MSLEQAFLADILAQPDDDTPRLVYADWLEEQGEAARAEFIRLQVERERLGRQKSREARRQARQLRHRERQLLARHRQAWLGGLLGFVERYRFRGGLLDELWMTPARLLTHGGLLAGLPTVRAVDLEWRGRPEDPPLAELLACPHLVWVTGLRVTVPYLLFDPAGLPPTQGLPHLPRLRVLDLSRNPLGAAGAALLASAANMPNLTELDLSTTWLDDAGAEALAGAAHFPRLTRANLRFNGITDAGAEALAASPHLRALRHLDLRGNAILGHGADALRSRFGEGVDLRDQSDDIPF
jgi:uncharacterized protein (TIGR02996 family)